MNPLKEKLIRFAESLGFHINEESIEDISLNVNYPDNWDEMSEDEQMAWKKKNMNKNVLQPEPAPEPEPEPEPAEQVKPNASKPEVPKNLVWLNNLIDEMGGQDSFKGVLLAAVESVEVMQQNQEIERANLVAGILANSRGVMEEAELNDLELPVLRKMSKAIVPPQSIDYGPIGGGAVKQNKDDIAEMPDIFASFQKNEKED